MMKGDHGPTKLLHALTYHCTTPITHLLDNFWLFITLYFEQSLYMYISIHIITVHTTLSFLPLTVSVHCTYYMYILLHVYIITCIYYYMYIYIYIYIYIIILYTCTCICGSCR